MTRRAIALLVITIISGLIGFVPLISGGIVPIAQVAFIIFLILFLIELMFGPPHP